MSCAPDKGSTRTNGVSRSSLSNLVTTETAHANPNPALSPGCSAATEPPRKADTNSFVGVTHNFDPIYVRIFTSDLEKSGHNLIFESIGEFRRELSAPNFEEKSACFAQINNR